MASISSQEDTLVWLEGSRESLANGVECPPLDALKLDSKWCHGSYSFCFSYFLCHLPAVFLLLLFGEDVADARNAVVERCPEYVAVGNTFEGAVGA